MQLGILGTGGVAVTLATRLTAVGHTVTLGSRDASAHGDLGFPVRANADVVAGHDVVFNATPGAVSLALAEEIGAVAFSGKVLVDVANASTPAFELVYPNASLGEKLQAALPDTHVVKTMNTAAMTVMTDPTSVPESSVFVSGDDGGAKATVTSLLADLGWPAASIVDLGGIATARGAEHYFLLFAAVMQSRRNADFNIRLVY
jgi:predicted dinucleotide-binding enzyme